MGFGVARGDATHLLEGVSVGIDWIRYQTYSEVLDVIHGDGIAEEVEESILEHAAMAVGENETIAVDPVGVLRVEAHEFVEEDVSDGGHAHGGTGMAGIGLEGGIDLGKSVYRLVVMMKGWNRVESHDSTHPTVFRVQCWEGNRGTYRKSTDRVDGLVVQFSVAHDCGFW